MIREHTTWTAHCAGCKNEYGDPFDNEGEARAFIKEFPLCATCDGENY